LVIKQKGPFKLGYNPITSVDDTNNAMKTDFGILKLEKGQEEVIFEEKKECAFVLILGEVTFEWGNSKETVKRNSFLDEDPYCLHVPAGERVKITALSDDVEIAVSRAYNDRKFAPKFYTNKDYRIEKFGDGVLGNTSLRICKTIFDYTTADYSNLVVGEIISYPGKWSSYPPHDHAQPEIYFFKFYPEQGFGYTEYGEEVNKVRHNDTAVIDKEVTHSTVTAPGYAMYYIWVIRHLENNPWTTRNFAPEHLWMLEKDAKIWPDK